MKLHSRAFLFRLIATVSLTSGCACCDNPCWGWRFHPFHPCCGGCPAYSSPVSAPVVYRPPTVVSSGSDCPGCGGGVVIHQPAAPGGYPGMAYPPIIGNPMPLPGAPNHELIPSPMPVTAPGK
jgi:hypothetical protein